MSDYAEFLSSKAIRPAVSGIDCGAIPNQLFDHQRAIVQWAVRRGRAAIFASTGLGKSFMQLAWAQQLNDPVLILAPLAVAEQTAEEEAPKLGMSVRIAKDQADCSDGGIWITNYERMHRFDPSKWSGVVLDESSILKSLDGKIRTKLIEEWAVVPYRLCCTATPAPNDVAELANHAEFLGVMTRKEMLATWFVHDEGAAGWRLKGHAQEKFYEWLATWAVYIRRPSDLGFGDDGYDLPPLNIGEERVEVDWKPDGVLFPQLAGGIQGRHIARRGSMDARVARAAELIRHQEGQWIVWCGLNAEQDALAAELDADAVSIAGTTPDDRKISMFRSWRSGEARILLTKPSIMGFGLNLQNCHQVIFLGLGDSFEEYFQAIRRCWRFGQTEAVTVRIIVSEAEMRIVENVWAKEREHEETAAAVVDAMRDAERREVLGLERQSATYETGDASGDDWRMLLGDSVERLAELEDGSVGLSVHSPPFAQLYVYSNSDRDLGNSSDYGQFFDHYAFIIKELLRVTMPGRTACVHVQEVALKKVVDGVIGRRDFPGDVIRAYVKAGWIYDSRVTVDKNPQAAAIRTKSKSLMFVQKNKDSAWSRLAMADYILIFRAPGDNPEPIKTDCTNEEWIIWAHPVWYDIRETLTLQFQSARSERDEKHICPLQLGTVERCVRLWSNRGDVVLDPFAGIGTVPYVAVKHGRRGLGIELKPEYFAQATRNLAATEVAWEEAASAAIRTRRLARVSGVNPDGR